MTIYKQFLYVNYKLFVIKQKIFFQKCPMSKVSSLIFTNESLSLRINLSYIKFLICFPSQSFQIIKITNEAFKFKDLLINSVSWRDYSIVSISCPFLFLLFHLRIYTRICLHNICNFNFVPFISSVVTKEVLHFRKLILFSFLLSELNFTFLYYEEVHKVTFDFSSLIFSNLFGQINTNFKIYFVKIIIMGICQLTIITGR